MAIDHVADAFVGPAAGVVHQARRIFLLEPRDVARGVVLPPSLVERHPHDDRRRVAQRRDDVVQLAGELLFAFGRVVVAARHVLPHQHPEPIAVVVPARGLHLDVLPDRVEAHLLLHLDVEPQGLVGRGGVQPVRPPALIELAELEERLVVEEQPVEAVARARHGDLPHARVTRDGVAARQPYLHCVEKRIRRRPELRVRNRDANSRSRYAGRAADGAIAVEHAHGGGRRTAARGFHRDVQRARIDVRVETETRDVRGRHRLEPDRLPDPRDGRVPDAARVEHLLAPRLRPFVGRIPHPDDQLLRRGVGQRVGDVERERIVPAAMLAGDPSVHGHQRLPIDRAEVQQQTIAPGEPGFLEGASIPEPLVGPDRFRDAAQRRLDRKRDEDPAGKAARPLPATGGDRVLPRTVEVLPRRSRHLRPWILGQRMLAVHVRGPPRHEPRRGRRVLT